MKWLKLVIVGAFAYTALASGAITLEECRVLAVRNYPLLERYDFIEATKQYTLDNLSKGYFPQITFSGQATLQSDVTTLPSVLKNIAAANGFSIGNLNRDQYRIGLDVNQIVYDGGSIRAAQKVARAESETQAKEIDVQMYALRGRVDDLYFGILLLDENLRLNEELQVTLADNCRKLESMFDGGIAMESDIDIVRAEILDANRQKIELESAREAYVTMLEIFIGQKLGGCLTMPEVVEPTSNFNMRPELSLYDARIRNHNARMEQINAGLRPTLHLFAQGYYGYPGYNMFEDMVDHRWSLNGIVGLKVTWNIGNFYTCKNNRRKIDIAVHETENAREVFLFNNKLQTVEERAAIERYRRLMSDDEKIIALRYSVRKTAEAKLEHGIIDVNELLQEITRENRARIEYSTHRIQMTKSIYELKNTLNQ